MAFFIFFNLVLTKLQDAFYRLLKFKITYKIEEVKVGDYNRFLMKKQTKTAKVEYLLKFYH